MTNVIIPNSVTEIEGSFVNGCDGLVRIVLPNSLKEIENGFNECTNLETIEYNGNLTYLYSNVFDSTKWYTNQPDGVVYFGNAVYKYKGTMPANTTIEIRNGTTCIGSSAFSGCSGLTSITIPDSVTDIGGEAFKNCTGLTSITIPDSVTNIGSSAFYGCTKLVDVTIPDSVTSIGSGAFSNCTSVLNRVNINDIESWCNISFGSSLSNPLYYAKNLYLNGELITELTIPDSVTSIGRYSFYNCTSLTSAIIPESVASVGDSAFYGCTKLETIEYSGDLTYLGSSAFYSTKWYSNQSNGVVYFGSAVYGYKGTMPANTTVEIRNGTTCLGPSAFSSCTKLTSITIPNSVTSIRSDAFNNCTGLSKVNITDIASWCDISFGNEYANPLYYAKNLYLNGNNVTSLTIPDSVTSIGDYAFYNCTSLTSVAIPDSVTSIGSSAFSGCTGLSSVNITDIASWCNITFGNYTANPLYYAKNLYLNGNKVTSLAIPSTITRIEDYAFSGCTGLTSVTIPDSVTSIGASAFNSCTGLTSITIPDSVTDIGEETFKNCTSLTSVTIPDSVTSIGDEAFNNCTGLSSVNITDIESWCNISFNFYDSNPLHYAHNLYLNGELVTDLTIPSTIIRIKDYVFQGCTSLTSVTIPDSVTSIGYRGFYGCTYLNDITMSDSLKTIEKYAFGNCTNLTEIIIPDSVTRIGDYGLEWGYSAAFSGCTNLETIQYSGDLEYISENVFNDTKWYNDKPDGLVYISHLVLGYKGTMPANTTISIMDGTTHIGANAFYGCSNLTGVELPNSVTSIGLSSFGNCAETLSATYDGTLAEFKAITGYKYLLSKASVTLSDGTVLAKGSTI